MRKIVHATVLTTFSTLLGLIPLAASAQIAPNQVSICNRLSSRITFQLDRKAQSLSPGCGTYSGGSTFLFYTEYGNNPRYVVERALVGGKRYNFERTPSGGFDIVKVEIIPK